MEYHKRKWSLNKDLGSSESVQFESTFKITQKRTLNNQNENSLSDLLNNHAECVTEIFLMYHWIMINLRIYH